MKNYRFVAVEFPDDPNVVGRLYWYLCDFESAEVGSLVVAPLGSHNRPHDGIIRKVMIADEFESPYQPFERIKKIEKMR